MAHERAGEILALRIVACLLNESADKSHGHGAMSLPPDTTEPWGKTP